jgi:hypothetical protein
MARQEGREEAAMGGKGSRGSEVPGQGKGQGPDAMIGCLCKLWPLSGGWETLILEELALSTLSVAPFTDCVLVWSILILLDLRPHLEVIDPCFVPVYAKNIVSGSIGS